MKNRKLKIHFLSALALVFFLLLAFGSTDNNSSSTSSTEPEKKIIPLMTENEYLKYFQTKWDSVKLYKQNGFLQYEDYYKNLTNVVTEMADVLMKDPAFNGSDDYKKTPLGRLCLKLSNSKRYNEAASNYEIYGQPNEYDLKAACETYLEKVLNDPSSLNIEEWDLRGQSKKGWIVYMKYRAKNAFGALVLQYSIFEVSFNSYEKWYYVNNVN